MTMQTPRRMLLTLAFLVCLSQPTGGQVTFENPVALDPTKVIGPDTCTKCHANELNVWRATPHFQTYTELQRRPEAEVIANKMGLRSIKRSELCIQCHYTMQKSGARVKAIAGVSCESCHGAARDWIAIHNDYGGPTATKQSESPEHRRQRLMKSIQAGMRNPANLYLIARGCCACHMVPNQQLVNVGGHQPGSEGFELVAWSQGSLRHNFQRTDGQSNPPSSRERLRAMYVVGKIAALEFSLRATAVATETEKFGFINAQRAYDLRQHLAEIQEKIESERLSQILEIAYEIRLKTNNTEALIAAADQISELAFEFAADAEKMNLSAIDGMLPSESDYK